MIMFEPQRQFLVTVIQVQDQIGQQCIGGQFIQPEARAASIRPVVRIQSKQVSSDAGFVPDREKLPCGFCNSTPNCRCYVPVAIPP